ncbi:MAG: OadG family protein [Lachnospiraceae bacterium]|nr:OadG family protein [Lachnospiraceae bacterium]
MKKMRKLLLFGCVLTLLFSLTACNKKEEKDPGFSYDVDELVTDTVGYAESLFQMNDDELDMYSLNYRQQLNSDSSYEVLLNGIDQVKDLKKEVGNYVGFYLKEDKSPKYKKIVNDDSVTISTTARFEKNGKKMDVVVKYTYAKGDTELVKSAISYEPQYSLAHRMKQAGMNTLMGMGIVIIVLAFLSVLISLFVHVSKLEKAVVDFKQRKEERKRRKAERKSRSYDDDDDEEEEELSITDPDQTDESQEMEDTELVAVITAAIAASSQNMSKDGFVVRSIKRVPGSKWNRN